MCGRFGSSFSADDLKTRYDLLGDIPRFHNSYNIAPSFTIPVILRKSPNKSVLMKWGFIPHWADPNKFKLHPINARDDSLDSPMYRDAFAHTRCIIPFSFFYEWKKYNLEGKQQKHPYFINIKNESIMSFAGIYSERKDAEGMPLYTCAIVTTKPNELINKIHNRMPVILHKKDEDLWLDSKSDLKKVKNLLKPYESKDMQSYRVSEKVNNLAIDKPDLIKEVK